MASHLVICLAILRKWPVVILNGGGGGGGGLQSIIDG